MFHRLSRQVRFLCVALAAAAAPGFADTTAFTITDDPALNTIVAEVRSSYLATRAQNQSAFNRLDVVLLVPNTDGTWRRGSYNPTALAYPASTVKLAYLAAAMKWCRENGHPYDYLDDKVGPMIRISDNYACGTTVDAITGAPNIPDCKKLTDPRWPPFYDKRQYTEKFLAARGLLENQTVLNKTYPTNSGSGPVGAEQLCLDVRGGAGNRMQPKAAASLMLEIQKGAIEPGALPYMKNLLTHDRWSADSVFGYGLPPGTIYENKWGAAYDTLEDIAYIKLPNGKEFILAAYSNAYSGTEPSQPFPYDVSVLGRFAEMMVERLGFDAGSPASVKVDNGTAGFSTTGAWSVTSSASERYGADYIFKSGSTGAASATWTLNVPEAGLYEVSVLYSQGTNRATDAPFTVNHAGGATTTRINQQSRGGRWVKLGDYNFNAGTGSIVLTDAVADATKVVIADAVKATKWPAGATPAPAAPSGLAATAVSTSQANLTWSDNSPNEGNFVIERRTGTGAFSVIATVPANTTAYSASGLAAKTSYGFRVKATNATGSSEYSNIASVTTPRR